jgi:hypothetical protein
MSGTDCAKQNSINYKKYLDKIATTIGDAAAAAIKATRNAIIDGMIAAVQTAKAALEAAILLENFYIDNVVKPPLVAIESTIKTVSKGFSSAWNSIGGGNCDKVNKAKAATSTIQTPLAAEGKMYTDRLNSLNFQQGENNKLLRAFDDALSTLQSLKV